MWSPSAVFLSFTAFSTVVQGVSLSDALTQAGASEFAALIASDPVIVALYNSSKVKTVFAPIDGSRSATKLKSRDANAQRIAQIQSSNAAAAIAAANQKRAVAVRGVVIPTNLNDNSTNLKGQSQNVVGEPPSLAQSNVAKRQNGFTLTTVLAEPQTVTITYSPLTPDCTTTTILPPPTTVTVYSTAPSPSIPVNPPSLLKIFSGLGNSVNVIEENIPYDGGVIQLVDSYFTFPELISKTAIADNHTTFAQLGVSAGLTDTIDNTPEITCFIPTNAAFAQSNSTSSYTSTASLLSGHIIPDFLGYLPSLTNGASFKTQGGTNVTVTISASGDYFINNAKIIASNLIVENGVCHVIDSIITPSVALPTPFTGDALPSAKRSFMELASWSFAICLGVALLI